MKKTVAALACLALAACLWGCSGGSTQQQQPAQQPDTTAPAETTAMPHELSDTMTLDGVTLSIDPSWENNSNEDSLRFDPTSSSVIVVTTYTDGSTKDLETFTQKDALGADYTIDRSWDENGVSYQIISGVDKDDGSRYTYLTGSADGGAGFSVLVNLGKDAVTDENIATMNAVFDSVVFDPSAVK